MCKDQDIILCIYGQTDLESHLLIYFPSLTQVSSGQLKVCQSFSDISVYVCHSPWLPHRSEVFWREDGTLWNPTCIWVSFQPSLGSSCSWLSVCWCLNSNVDKSELSSSKTIMDDRGSADSPLSKDFEKSRNRDWKFV